MTLSPQTTLVSIKSATMVCCVVLYLVLSESAFGQAVAQLETASIESRVTRQMKLTPKDWRTLRPLIELESDGLLLLYEYYADQNDPDFLTLWDAVRSRRLELAKWPSAKLTQHQKKALLLAGLELDARILEQWLDDYLEMLNDLLELDLVQFKRVQTVFDIEHRERLKILREEAGRLVRLDGLWQKLCDEREQKMEQILSGSQLRSYRQMTKPPRLIARTFG